MNKLLFGLMTVLSLLIIGPFQLKSETVETKETIVSNKEANAAEAKILLTRLAKIDGMDKSEMTFKEKRELRREVRSINSQLKMLEGGVYLSVGAIIIIILLLILLL